MKALTSDLARKADLPGQIISADSHVAEPAHCFSSYIDPVFRDRAPRLSPDSDGGDAFIVDGLASTIPIGGFANAGCHPRDFKIGQTRFEDVPETAYVGEARLAAQDADGLAAEVIYPTIGLLICDLIDADYKQACMWAYNRWLIEEFCAASPDRLLGIGMTAVRSVAEAIQDLRQLKDLRFRGVLLPSIPATDEDYSDPCFDPLWEAAVELDLPVTFHRSHRESQFKPRGISPQHAVLSGAATRRRPRAMHIAQLPQRSIFGILDTFIFGGIFERHPRLRIVCAEVDAGWAPYFAYRMDHNYTRHRFWMNLPSINRMPSEYFFEHVYLTFQDDWVALKVSDLLNKSRLLWANDFPHADSTWPYSRNFLIRHTADLDFQDKEAIMYGNSASLFLK